MTKYDPDEVELDFADILEPEIDQITLENLGAVAPEDPQF